MPFPEVDSAGVLVIVEEADGTLSAVAYAPADVPAVNLSTKDPQTIHVLHFSCSLDVLGIAPGPTELRASATAGWSPLPTPSRSFRSDPSEERTWREEPFALELYVPADRCPAYDPLQSVDLRTSYDVFWGLPHTETSFLAGAHRGAVHRISPASNERETVAEKFMQRSFWAAARTDSHYYFIEKDSGSVPRAFRSDFELVEFEGLGRVTPSGLHRLLVTSETEVIDLHSNHRLSWFDGMEWSLDLGLPCTAPCVTIPHRPLPGKDSTILHLESGLGSKWATVDALPYLFDLDGGRSIPLPVGTSTPTTLTVDQRGVVVTSSNTRDLLIWNGDAWAFQPLDSVVTTSARVDQGLMLGLLGDLGGPALVHVLGDGTICDPIPLNTVPRAVVQGTGDWILVLGKDVFGSDPNLDTELHANLVRRARRGVELNECSLNLP